ncbi:MAG: aspartate/glutamate racemase family protein, partial [Synergistales bacterium]|nr:aspartate/glutamate racemase family protein [Synergistales bacterium]
QGLEVIIPGIEDRNFIQNVIATELAVGDVKESSRERTREIIKTMGDVGAEGILLACTELPLLIRSAEYDLEVFNSGRIHALAAAEMSLKEE